MLDSKEIQGMIEAKDQLLKIIKPIMTSTCLLVWNNFRLVYLEDKKQEYVTCNDFFELLACKPSTGTSSLAKHIRYCRKLATRMSSAQTTLHQHFVPSKNEPTISNRVEQEIRTACVEFCALDYRPSETSHKKF